MSESQTHNPDHEDVDAGRIHDKDEAEFVAYAVKRREEDIQRMGNKLLDLVESGHYDAVQGKQLERAGILKESRSVDTQAAINFFGEEISEARTNADIAIDAASKTYKFVNAAKSGKAIENPVVEKSGN